ncbi:hypothetical protein [Moorena sp. SIO4A5]|uniref:hypothetical protein n=1 Tax=Moorena sp. SIO4A5 TaxID=2607838 RepID=UPI0013C8A3D1|nr:hypothetical protein [Moorena sp. SIO4A5]NEO23556.1 hypothetical protein [Moorena sp. SIO4A5]
MTKNQDFAKVAQVDLGNGCTIEGLWNPVTDEFGSAFPQISKVFFETYTDASKNSLVRSNINRTIKRLLGKDFSLVRWKSELNSNEVTVLKTKDIEDLIWELVVLDITKKNENLIPAQKIARKIGKGIFGMGLIERYRDGFGLESNKEFRDNFLKEQLDAANAKISEMEKELEGAMRHDISQQAIQEEYERQLRNQGINPWEIPGDEPF